MIDKETIEKMKENGDVIVTVPTFKKSVELIAVGEKVYYGYKGKIYNRHEWLLTYGHEQYERLYNL
jgi:hypothetical protein